MSNTARNNASIPKEQPGDDPDDVLFSSLYGVRTIELNRPKKLNSLNGSMARKILPRLKEWENSQMANVIMIAGAGPKAFCAGGDVAELAKQNATPEGQKKSGDYFALEYKLDHLIATYSKPYIAVMDGITMGGGVGLSVHAPFRIATEKTVFAMPETTIGFFPDVGGSFFLSRMDGEVGTYLALTSERLLGVQALYAGIATHYLDSSVLQPLTTRLSELNFRDHASLEERLKLINSTLAEFTTELPSPDSYPSAQTGNLTGSLREAIDRIFSKNTIAEILSGLDQEAQSSDAKLAEWAKKTSKTISQRSPTSLKVTLSQLRQGKKWSIDQTFKREHEMAVRFMAHPDFVEGVTARLVNKPATEPKWQPSSLDDVSDEKVKEFFTLPDGVEPLELMDQSQGAQKNYRDYPWAMYALPREADIEAAVKAAGSEGADAIKARIESNWHWKGKVGVKEKIDDYLSRKTKTVQGSKIVLKEGSTGQRPSL